MLTGGMTDTAMLAIAAPGNGRVPGGFARGWFPAGQDGEAAIVAASNGGARGLEGSGGFWRVLEGSGGFWRVLEGSGGFWRVS